MSDLREEVEAAFNTVAEANPEPVDTDPPAGAAAAAGPEDNPDDEIDPAGDDAGVDAGDGVDPPAGTADVDAAAGADAPPASWTAAEKAAWAKATPELKAAVLRRERESREAVRVDGTARKFVESIQQTIQPYAAMLTKSGLNPVSVMQESLQLAQALNAGTAQEKAETIGKMIMHFGIDIDALDKYIVDPKNARKEPSPAPAGSAYDPRKDPALSPLFAIAAQVEAKTAEALERQIEEAKAWPGFEEARDQMADLVDWVESRGDKITIAQAYTRITGKLPPAKAAATGAATANGGAGATVLKLPTPEQISQAAATLAKSRKAASAVAGQQRTPAPVNTDDIRATVAAAASGVL